ncbi:hypothetical protein K1T71_007753 [Dendrolimus kikuchii]|uniref:Uncharacterized protein n=1 Tax=Dendrolimus kikuchii TaxID=765133 RepID=A0ACC1CYK1_9NEOP|nr:hypothetical protein K1T71_007753 [Dendrolimus kikuchii]
MSKIVMRKSWADNEVDEIVEDRKASKEKMKTDSRENSSSRKRHKPNSYPDQKPRTQGRPLKVETDLLILQRRQKQIDYGKNTVGYHNYMQHVPFDQRTKEHPKTPDKYTKYSRRSWDTLIKMWRKELHKYDTTGNKECDELEDSDNDDENED